MKPPKYVLLIVAALISVVSLVACDGDSGEVTSDLETTGDRRGPEVVEIAPLDSGSGASGDQNPYVVVASSLGPIRRLPGLSTFDLPSGSDEGSTYLAAFWGEKATGGYTLEVQSASLSKDTATVVLRLKEPPEGAVVSQAITYPYSVVRLTDLDPATTEFVLEDQSGQSLDWPVRKL